MKQAVLGNNKSYQILDWDTDLFGFTVAKVIPEKILLKSLKENIATMKKKNISLVYWASDPNDFESQEAAKRLGGILVCEKIIFEIDFSKHLNKSIPRTNEISEYLFDSPNVELEDLAIQSGHYSRFKVDPAFPDELFKKLYKTWIMRSTNKMIAKNVFVYEVGKRIVGMVTVGGGIEFGEIGLVSVAEEMRGKGIGKALIRFAQSWFISEGYRKAQVATQAQNIAACRLYENCGFRKKKTENIYHFWIGNL
ncbi:MAG: GNAT family N-acetyltransferase [Candidatus Saganbacteria bacterium]|nr:GNAT family N-acetyltransferase [Candidatus Saganbacteria bacterium]